ncbi:ATP-binding protein [Rhodospirillum rubrum]|uniref:histidine kinase n=1 Tax=Rhodospirillum rubrum (strain ATCC 11170 / ATH 1.1.1 / DSM 467 / LMG 4362 / NCIMB 8255 / S1) TaxID=269796 RepID=Q2RNF8_RHORT|nr:ATP-binding protein [Rhodospirillum rubrum]ABC24337.1 Periplasmic Sensor Signal Transduction Histidine Kinase [Rhodospirillum rubrum ATCC 11170]AEO50088.1 periplasmic sensor Signal transduction histidine kinase [Rhodospirillum rubrum F11]MBK5956057.1 histidine kinase [Rhodospirillum rubrum]QXG80264.1 PAS domain-containing protein [Rhodospirillum rubrum]HAP98650.1 histidine kinase [Rhodospirillum rubrum]
MDRLTPSLGRLIGAAMLVCVPATAVLLGLTLWGRLSVGVALVAGVLIWTLTALLLRSILREFMVVSRHIRGLGGRSEAGEGAAPTPRLEIAQGLLGAAQHLDRGWRRRTQALRDQLRSDEQVLNTLPDPLLMIAKEAVVTRANEAARSLFGRDPAGQEIITLLRDPGVLDSVERVLAGGTAPRQTIWVMPGAVEREFEVRATPLPSPSIDGSVALLGLHDITALRRLEQMRADFVANASHELRTPLSSLIGFTETLSTSAKNDPEARERFLAIMLEQGRRMQRLIEDLLSLSRIEMEEHTPPDEAVVLPGLIASVTRFLEIKAREKTMTLSVEAPPDLPPAIGDADQLSQIFQNLLDNAIKYGRPGTPVEVRLAVVERGPPAMPAGLRAPCLRVSVIDHGEGIAKAHLPRLTERFYRVDKARSRALGGTGLGLAIVKHVVVRHRGAMTIESDPGLGTTVSVFLPLHGPRPPRRAAPSA